MLAFRAEDWKSRERERGVLIAGFFFSEIFFRERGGYSVLTILREIFLELKGSFEEESIQFQRGVIFGAGWKEELLRLVFLRSWEARG